MQKRLLSCVGSDLPDCAAEARVVDDDRVAVRYRASEVLAALRRVSGVTNAWLVDETGDVLAATPGGTEGELQGAIAGALTGTLRQAVRHLTLGSVREIIVEAADGVLLVVVGSEAPSVIVLARGRVNLGLLRLAVRRARSRPGAP